MQSMCLIRLKVSLGGGGEGGKRHKDLFFWVLPGDGGKGWREGHSMMGKRKKRTLYLLSSMFLY